MADQRSRDEARVVQYDVVMARLERRFFPDTRAWVCGRARGATLEVAVGTGANLSHYGEDVTLTAIDNNPVMLDRARERAARLGRSIDFRVGDAMALPFRDGVFDTLVCTFALCEVRDDGAAVAEFARVLRPGGSLLLADHVVASGRFVRAGQHLLEWLTIPLSGEHYTRRPLERVRHLGLDVVAADRFAHGAVERVHAVVGARTGADPGSRGRLGT